MDEEFVDKMTNSADLHNSKKYEKWLAFLSKENCHVLVKYKPEYYGGKEEVLKWVPSCNATLFWREDSDGPLSIWWRCIESFAIIGLDLAHEEVVNVTNNENP